MWTESRNDGRTYFVFNRPNSNLVGGNSLKKKQWRNLFFLEDFSFFFFFFKYTTDTFDKWARKEKDIREDMSNSATDVRSKGRG